MAVLSDSARAACAAQWMRENRDMVGAVTKADIRGMIDGLDTKMNDIAADINSAIPLPARSVLTPAQKAQALAIINDKRYGVEAEA